MRKDEQARVGAVAARRPWNRPKLSRIRAGEAEIGANPILPEGAFAFGS